jgi:hypothetical protein
MYTMNPSTYSDFTSISIAFGDTPNTWMGRLPVTEIYWCFALFLWIIVTNLDLIEEWLRPSLSVQPISEYIKGQRWIRRLHEISILLLSFGALLFLVRRQDNNKLSPSPSPSSGLHPCSIVQGKLFWRCVCARSMGLPERARVVQHARSIVDDEGYKHPDAKKHMDNFSTTFYPLLSDHLDMYLTAATTGSQSTHVNDCIRFNHSDTSFNVSVDDDELVFESIVSYLRWRHELEPQY